MSRKRMLYTLQSHTSSFNESVKNKPQSRYDSRMTKNLKSARLSRRGAADPMGPGGYGGSSQYLTISSFGFVVGVFSNAVEMEK